MSAAPQHRYLLAVSDLTITSPWEVGPVRLLPSGSAVPLISEYRARREGAGIEWYDRHVDEGIASRLDAGTIADVCCDSPEAAFELVAGALSILRIHQRQRSPMTDTDFQTFGLPGEVASWHVEYIDLHAGPGQGFFWEGAISDWTFSDEDLAAFAADSGLQFLCHSLGSDQSTELGKRALLGAGLLSLSTLAQNPDQKLLAAVMAVEVLIGDDRRGDKKFRLARRHAFLTCSVPQGKMCGRDWPACPYLKLNPDVKKDFAELTSLRKAFENGAFPYCARYYEILKLYDARNKAAHDGSAGLKLKEVRNALYPINLWLVPRILKWYADHPDDLELRELDAEIVATAS